MEKVSVWDCPDYRRENVDRAVKSALEALPFQLPVNTEVLIKPNIMSQNRPEQATVTHPSIVEGLCALLRDNRCKISIGDSISFYQTGLTKKAFQTTGLDMVAKKYDAKLVAFEEETPVKVSGEQYFLKDIYIPKAVLDAGMIINAPKLKSHSFMRLSGAVKNMFGIMPGGYKQRLHGWSDNIFHTADAIIDLTVIAKPALSIMDAVICLDGGPTAAGKPTKAGKILASVNSFALDAVAGRMIGFKPSDIPMLIRGEKRGLISNYMDIEVLENEKSIPIDEYPFPLIRFKRIQTGHIPPIVNNKNVFVTETFVRPRVLKPETEQAPTCINICPTGAIIKNQAGLLAIDEEKCISCYHCFYACGKGIIGIKSGLMNKLIRFARFLLRL